LRKYSKHNHSSFYEYMEEKLNKYFQLDELHRSVVNYMTMKILGVPNEKLENYVKDIDVMGLVREFTQEKNVRIALNLKQTAYMMKRFKYIKMDESKGYKTNFGSMDFSKFPVFSEIPKLNVDNHVSNIYADNNLLISKLDEMLVTLESVDIPSKWRLSCHFDEYGHLISYDCNQMGDE